MKHLLIPVFFIWISCVHQPVPAQNFFGFGSQCGHNSSHNLFAGTRNYYDRLLYVNHTSRPASFFGRQTVDVEFPPRGQYPQGVISYFQAVDQFTNGNGGCAQVRAGGVGHTYLRMRLTSRWNQGLDYVITVFGR